MPSLGKVAQPNNNSMFTSGVGIRYLREVPVKQAPFNSPDFIKCVHGTYGGEAESDTELPSS